VQTRQDSYLPTDAMSFYLQGVPILSAFTGTHSDYNTPRDTADRINYEGTAKIAKLMALLTRSLAVRDQPPEYRETEKPVSKASRANLRAYLGTIPEYAESDLKGVQLNGVAKGGPAEKAGLRRGDLIVKLAGRTIENIYDYTYALNALKVDQPVKILVERDGHREAFLVTPASRE
jgi:predicted metalloprotease with PDZ domain